MKSEHKCSCDLTYFDHAPACEARGENITVSNTGDAVASGPGAIANTGLSIHADAAKAAAAVSGYQWHPEEGTDEEAAQLRDDYVRLHDWLTAHTKVDPGKNAVDSAINLLETARLIMSHLTPAMMSVLHSAMSALKSAGVDVGNIAIVEPIHEASLGLATTEQLLIELRARGDVDLLIQEDKDLKRAGHLMANAAQRLLADLPEPVLSYRTVNES